MAKDIKRILIIEDERPLSKVLKDNLELVSDIEVTQAYDGEEGLEKALAIEPDLILLDVIMPKMDGIQCLRALRAHPSTASIKVVVLTNVATEPTLGELQKMKFTDYIVKSNWNINEVTERILSFIRIT
jgi:two-component system, OmpR family, response regulator VicR